MKTPARLDGPTTCTALRFVTSAVSTTNSPVRSPRTLSLSAISTDTTGPPPSFISLAVRSPTIPITSPPSGSGSTSLHLSMPASSPAASSTSLSPVWDYNRKPNNVSQHQTLAPSSIPSRFSATNGRICYKSSKWLLSTFFTPSAAVLRGHWSSRGLTTAGGAVASDPDGLPEIDGFDPRPEEVKLKKDVAQRHQTRARARQILSIPRIPQMKTEDMLSMLDETDVAPADEYFNFHQDTYLRRYAPSDGPRVHYSDRPWDYEYPTYEESVSRNDHCREIYQELVHVVRLRQRSQSRGYEAGITLKAIHKVYQKLPEPRMLHIPATMRHKLLKLFGTPERRDTPSMLRYFAVINDVKNAGLALSRHEWNYCMAFSKRCVRSANETWLTASLKIWREMENDSSMKANEVTFNMLFDAASKCGNFTLAKMLYYEMNSRRITCNRFHHVSLMHYFGLKQDADGVRAAYREMVKAGEMIDTVVLNCAISGFLNSAEEAAADFVYNRMKERSKWDGSQPPEPPPDYRARRVVTHVLMMWSRVARKHPTLRPAMQMTSHLAPDIRTYRIFVQHYAVRAGNMARVASYLDDMRQFEVPMDGRIFVSLFEAFAKHGGGFPEADFSYERLNKVFSALISALDSNVSGVYVDSWMMIWVLRAFMQCGPEAGVIDAFTQLRSRCVLGETRMAYLQQFLRLVMEKRDPFAQRDRLGLEGGGYTSQWTGMFGRRTKDPMTQ